MRWKLSFVLNSEWVTWGSEIFPEFSLLITTTLAYQMTSMENLPNSSQPQILAYVQENQ